MSSPGGSRIVRFVVLSFVLLVACGLALDACTFALYPADPIPGAERGCYTAVERMLGMTAPSCIRSIEGGLALGLLAAAVILVLRMPRGAKGFPTQ